MQLARDFISRETQCHAEEIDLKSVGDTIAVATYLDSLERGRGLVLPLGIAPSMEG